MAWRLCLIVENYIFFELRDLFLTVFLSSHSPYQLQNRRYGLSRIYLNQILNRELRRENLGMISKLVRNSLKKYMRKFKINKLIKYLMLSRSLANLKQIENIDVEKLVRDAMMPKKCLHESFSKSFGITIWHIKRICTALSQLEILWHFLVSRWPLQE